ncbi:5,6-dimethylbenzimidazole synthase [Ruminiclostridium hungatei]|uniref:5,6-dimethylbenzimidazole synthase n=1 Tax=Ruminiclostridium hungatei TaxID=48256 RepID=A0A1V4SNY2_RUMHU|nr:nitroreductase family protein [Ruminiclostridium hungatei]OPX44961.1 5,6-dimethylbenzimidazole synthase [Ruminiclostridium hungatei]
MFLDLLKSRRSIRKFETREVEKEKLDTILKSALLAPSSRSKRPWEFVVVTDKEILQKLARSKEQGSSFLSGAPLGIAVIADHEACDVWVEDVSIASILIQLSAQSLGLGSCWIQVRERFHSESEGVTADNYIKAVLNIPEKYSVECIIAVGYPAEEKRAYTEDGLLYEKLHVDNYKACNP